MQKPGIQVPGLIKQQRRCPLAGHPSLFVFGKVINEVVLFQSIHMADASDNLGLAFVVLAGTKAALLSDTKNENGLSSRIEWIEMTSYAHVRPTCVFMAAELREDGELKAGKLSKAGNCSTAQ